MRPERILLATILSLALAVGTTPAGAQETTTETIGGQGDNVAVAIATKDGSSRFKVSFRIVRSNSDVVDNGNVAFAFASCEGCRSVAIAFQVVLVGGTPTIVVPENYAIALNFECIDCATLASAYQFVMGTDGNVHFSAEGNQALSEIRRAISELGRSDMPVDDIQAELDLLAADLRDVLANELVSSGSPDVSVEEVTDEGADPAQTAPPATETPEPTPESTPAPADGTTPSETETVSPSPQPQPTETQNPSPEPSPSPGATPTPVVSASG